MRTCGTTNSITHLLRSLQPCSQIPLRKAPKSKPKPKPKQQETPGVTRYYPYIPPGLVVDTVNPLKDREALSEILDLVFSPLAPTDTQEDRRLYQRAHDVYRLYRRRLEESYREREWQARERMFEAIEQLPENLYDESVQSEAEAYPDELAFQRAYREQLVKAHLSEHELARLDAFRMLMYLRFPHTETKQKNPRLFWLEEKKMVSRQKQASLMSRKAKTRA